MTRYSPREHTVLRSHPILRRIREELHRGPALIVYYHHQEHSYVLATMTGAVFQDHYVFKGPWPRVTQGEMGVLRRMFNPDRRFHDEDTRRLRKAYEDKTKDQVVVGRKDREMWHRIKARLKRKGGLRHERPLFNPPVLPGEA